MSVSVFDIFKIGIGPSSSHTVGPMKAAGAFVDRLADRGLLDRTHRVTGELFGSLALTGIGHGTDRAVVLGLLGEQPDRVDPDAIPALIDTVRTDGRLALGGRHPIAFDEAADLLLLRRQSLPGHPNGMRFTAFDNAGAPLDIRIYYSIGGGFVVTDEVLHGNEAPPPAPRILKNRWQR